MLPLLKLNHSLLEALPTQVNGRVQLALQQLQYQQQKTLNHQSHPIAQPITDIIRSNVDSVNNAFLDINCPVHQNSLCILLSIIAERKAPHVASCDCKHIYCQESYDRIRKCTTCRSPINKTANISHPDQLLLS